ncbi:MAG: hypothetical protein ACXVLQ_04670 [Bacteriovorax sp.]
MKFETEYKNIIFRMELERVHISDVTLLLGDKFNRLPNRTMTELKKGNLVPYNLIITSRKNDSDVDSDKEERCYYWSNVLLTSSPDSLLEDLGQYLDDEAVLEFVVTAFEAAGNDSEPPWAKVPNS